jgi:hypothetical protein
VLASALAMVTKRIELMIAVHPGMVDPSGGGEDGFEPRPHQRRIAVR